jgi:uncharacterized protein YbjT (DUF2867 family)
LLPALERRGASVRCLSRRPEALVHRVGRNTTVVAGDVLDPSSLAPALAGVGTAYYLVHSIGAGSSFSSADREGAENFAAAARASRVRRIVYLGGLGNGGGLSAHLASRQEVGEILRGSGVPTVEFRASIVIGSGSASFEIVRALVERLPVVVVPRWVETASQPIAIEDVIDYLVAALELDLAGAAVFEIGGADRVTYAGLMREYARQRGLRRRFMPVRFLGARMSRVLLSLVTPVYARIGAAMVESLRHETVVGDRAAPASFGVNPRGFGEAIERALRNEDREFAETRWSDALSASEPRSWGGVAFGRRRVASRAVQVAVPAARAFAPIQRIGGSTGWFYANSFWRLRGRIDALVGGVGLRRGRRDPLRLGPGDTLDFWRVERIEPDRRLRLRAEMRIPGRLWLVFEIEPGARGTTVRQTAIFDPAGIVGAAYWYALYPVHRVIFDGMLRGIRAQITAGQDAGWPR